MKKPLIVSTLILVLIAFTFFMVRDQQGGENQSIVVPAKEGKFEVRIITTGELEAKNAVQILGPTSLRKFRIFDFKIQNIAEEGTLVKKGDWVASLDPSELINRISDAQIEVEQEQSQYIQTKLDTALEMRKERDELINLKYAVEEREIILDQSQYEPPATIKQEEINLDKAVRAYEQAKENYKIKHQQNVAKMMEVTADLNKSRRELKALEQMLQLFTIRAPEDGMLIFRKGWDGRPIREGSQISAWDPVVATLPDLSVMLSRTYVNEVDVRKVKLGQTVDIGLDAFPDKKLKGRVIDVANVGEQRPNSDAKVFQVQIELQGADDYLKPGMTTSNAIIIKAIESAVFIPLECLFNEYDSVTYVYKREGLNVVKQEVMIGETNSDEVVIQSGIAAGDRVYLTVPNGMEDESVRLLPEMDGKRFSPDRVEERTGQEQIVTSTDTKKSSKPGSKGG